MIASAYLTSSLKLLGILAPGESLSADEADDALQVFSDLLDGWAAERLTVREQLRTENALVSGTQRYTLGVGGDWAQAWPSWIDHAGYLTTDGREIPITVFTDDEWARIGLKDQTGSYPLGIYVNPTYPLAAVDVWPVPDDGMTGAIVLYAPSPSPASVPLLTTALSVPPGWAKALRYNLAVDLMPSYPAGENAAVRAEAATLKATIKRGVLARLALNELQIDPAYLRTNRSVRRSEFESGNL